MEFIDQYLDFLRRIDSKSKQIVADNTKKTKLEDNSLLSNLCYDIQNEIRYINEEIWKQRFEENRLSYDENEDSSFYDNDEEERLIKEKQKNEFYDEIISKYFDDFDSNANCYYLEDGIACFGNLLDDEDDKLVLRIVHKNDYDNLFDDVSVELFNVAFTKVNKPLVEGCNGKIDLIDCSIIQFLNDHIVSDQRIEVKFNQNKLEIKYNLEKSKNDVTVINIKNKEERELAKNKFMFCVSALNEELEYECDKYDLTR